MRRMCGEKDGEEGETLDDILKRHNDFLDTCLTECLLTNVGLLKVLGLRVRLPSLCRSLKIMRRSGLSSVSSFAQSRFPGEGYL